MLNALIMGNDRGIFLDSGKCLRPILDTLDHLRTSTPKKVCENVETFAEPEPLGAFKKRARAKFYGFALASGLANLDSDLQKSYKATLFCASTLSQDGTKITSKYCGHRWCVCCNRIRVAKLIKGYEKPLAALPDLWFVTLTLPNVPDYQLRGTIDRMIKEMQGIQDYFKKRRQRKLQAWQLVGLRKIECTYNVEARLFHPHFHFVISGKEAARALVDEWLSRVGTASVKAQDLRPATAGTEKELFKYFSKLVTKVNGKNASLLEPLDVIFQAMRRRRVFQPIGIEKNVSEEIEALQAVEVTGIAPDLIEWHWDNSDWVDHETGEAFTGYVPSAQMETLVLDIVPNVEYLGKEGREAVAKEPRKWVGTANIPGIEAHRRRMLLEMDGA